MGSPFSIGIIMNLKQYWIGSCSSSHRIWQFNNLYEIEGSQTDNASKTDTFEA
jgi:hypothetical protein